MLGDGSKCRSRHAGIRDEASLATDPPGEQDAEQTSLEGMVHSTRSPGILWSRKGFALRVTQTYS